MRTKWTKPSTEPRHHEPEASYIHALQRAIEYAVKGKQIPESIACKCPHHAAMLNNLSRRSLSEFDAIHAESLDELKRLK